LEKSVLLAFSLLLFLSTAYAVPGIPHQFYGNVTVNGSPAEGATVTAKISGTEVASTVSKSGTYGSNYGSNANLFFITDPNGSNSGKKIEFFLNGNKVAEYTFANGGYTQLDLSFGAAPSCGDTSCNGSETCGSCPQDCGACPAAPPGGGPGGSSGGSSTGGGGSSSLTINVVGNCINQPVEVMVLNPSGNPAPSVMVSIAKNMRQIEEKITGFDGRQSFTVGEAGEYLIGATKTGYTFSTKTITLSDCSAISGGTTGAEGDGVENSGNPPAAEGDLCKSLDCDDKNPCTSDSCRQGFCVYSRLNSGKCGENASCKEGLCVQATEGNGTAQAGTNISGFFGLNGMQQGSLAGVLAALCLGVLFLAFKIKKGRK